MSSETKIRGPRSGGVESEASGVASLAREFQRHREQLRRLVARRIDPRVRRRIDPSDVLQESFVELARQVRESARDPELPVDLWMRLVTSSMLAQLHRYHLGTQKRDAHREEDLSPQSSIHCDTLAARFAADISSPSHHAVRAEVHVALHDSLRSMDEIDRRILVLRHFEEMSNIDVALALEIDPCTASRRYTRALTKLGNTLLSLPGFFPG